MDSALMVERMYYIVDGRGNYYCVNGEDQLIVSQNRDWAEFLTHFCYVISGLKKYQDKLNDDLSKANLTIVKTVLKQIDGLSKRIYTPRMLPEVFEYTEPEIKGLESEEAMEEYRERSEEAEMIVENLVRRETNYNAAEGYKTVKRLQMLRNERKRVKNELESVQTITGCFACDEMRDAYQYCAGRIQEIME